MGWVRIKDSGDPPYYYYTPHDGVSELPKGARFFQYDVHEDKWYDQDGKLWNSTHPTVRNYMRASGIAAPSFQNTCLQPPPLSKNSTYYGSPENLINAKSSKYTNYGSTGSTQSMGRVSWDVEYSLTLQPTLTAESVNIIKQQQGYNPIQEDYVSEKSSLGGKATEYTKSGGKAGVKYIIGEASHGVTGFVETGFNVALILLRADYIDDLVQAAEEAQKVLSEKHEQASLKDKPTLSYTTERLALEPVKFALNDLSEKLKHVAGNEGLKGIPFVKYFGMGNEYFGFLKDHKSEMIGDMKVLAKSAFEGNSIAQRFFARVLAMGSKEVLGRMLDGHLDAMYDRLTG